MKVRVSISLDADDDDEAGSIIADLIERLRQRMDFFGFAPEEAPIIAEVA